MLVSHQRTLSVAPEKAVQQFAKSDQDTPRGKDRQLTLSGCSSVTRLFRKNPNQLLMSCGISENDSSATASKRIGSEGSRLSNKLLIVFFADSPTEADQLTSAGM